MMTQSCRQNLIDDVKPQLEFARVMGSSNGITLALVADGQSQMFSMNRHRLMALLESGFEALKNMEPGR
jgi:hypothetical protein